MPPKLPTTLGPRATPSVQRRVWSVDNTQVARAQQEIGQSMKNSGQQSQRAGDERHNARMKEAQKLERDRIRDLRNSAKRQADEFLIGGGDKEGLFAKSGANGVDVESEYKKFWGTLRESTLKDAGEGSIVELMEAELDDLNTMYSGKVLSHQSNQRKQYGLQVASANADSALHDVGYYFNDDAVVDRSMKVIEASVRAIGQDEGWDELTTQNKLRDARSNVHVTQLQSLTNSGENANIELAYNKFQDLKNGKKLTLEHRANLDAYFDKAMPRVRAKTELDNLTFTPPDNFSDAASFVIAALEGDDKIAKEPRGAIAKFGINSEANPDVDVKNLTRAEATDIAKKRYWDKNKIDDLPPNMRLVAFDTYFNHGPTQAKKMIKEAGNDPRKLLELRMDEYDRLKASGNPDHVKNHPGWVNRMAKLEQKMRGEQNDVQPEQVYQRAEALEKEFEGAGAEMIKMYEEQRKVSTIDRLKKQDELSDIIFDAPDPNNPDAQPLTLEQKEALVNEAELKGEIDKQFASSSRRYLASAEKLNGKTADPEMAELVTQMYGLNSIADMEPEKYLVGIRNIKMRIMDLRAEGRLSADDESTLNNQLKTLTSSKVANTTQNIAYQFGDGVDVFNENLPPEYMNQAIRQLFYDTQGQEELTDDEYKQKARDIVDKINQARRKKATTKISNIANQYSFASFAEAEQANVPAGQTVYIAGKKYVSK